MLMRAMRELTGFLSPRPWVLPSVAVLGCIASLAEGLGIGLLIPFLSSLTGNDTGSAGLVTRAVQGYSSLFAEDWRLIGVAASIAVLVVLSCAINFAYLWVMSHAATRVTHELRCRLFERFVDSDQLFLEAGTQGRQVKTIDGSAYRAGQAVISLCLLVANTCTVLVILTVLALISWKMTLIVLAGVAFAGLVVRGFIAHSMQVSKRFELGNGRLADTAVNVLSSLRMVRIFGQEAREAASFNAISEGVRSDQLRLETVRRGMAPLVDAIAAPLLIAGLVIATSQGIGVVVLLPFLLLVFRLQRFVREADIMRVHIAADAGAIFEVSDQLAASLPSRPRGQRDFARLEQGVRFDAVSFSHTGESASVPTLSEFSLDIRRGETLGIVGGSGAGKSTLINLLCGIHVPDQGRVLIDGADLNDIDLRQWRRRLGFAGQDAELRPGSILDNIAYGVPDASRAAVEEAARQASAHEFILSLPAGYSTPVGVRGMQLSGGERQRIALARALIRQPDILILDEATNAVDNATEALIRDALERLAGSLTMIVIAHRLSSIRHVDRVIVMHQGRIIEDGAPAVLMQKSGAFFDLNRHEGGVAAEVATARDSRRVAGS